MKQIASNYSYSPATNVVTLTGVNIDADQLLLIVAPQVGRTMYNFASVTGSVVAGSDTRVTLNASTAGLTTTSPLVIFYDDQASAQSVTFGQTTVTGQVELGPTSLNALESITVTMGQVTVTGGLTNTELRASAVTIGGTVTANIGNPVEFLGDGNYNLHSLFEQGSLVVGTMPPISGTVTANLSSSNLNSVTIGVRGTVTVGNSITIGSLPTLAPQLPRVTFIDGSGTVTTANTAITVFASSSTRSYLLVQVTTGSAFVNVGATATTVNGINLTAGQGYAWETTIPQGIVSLISTTTSSRYVAKEA